MPLLKVSETIHGDFEYREVQGHGSPRSNRATISVGLGDRIRPTSSDPQGSLTYTGQPRDLREASQRCNCALKGYECSPAMRPGKVPPMSMFSTGVSLNAQSEHNEFYRALFGVLGNNRRSGDLKVNQAGSPRNLDRKDGRECPHEGSETRRRELRREEGKSGRMSGDGLLVHVGLCPSAGSTVGTRWYARPVPEPPTVISGIFIQKMHNYGAGH